MLDKKTHTGVQLEQNYKYLVEKWGEWEIVGTGQTGLTIRYVDVGRALFSGLMVTFSTLTIVSLCAGLILSKVTFPLLAKHFNNNNNEMVDLATLKSASQIDQIVKSGEWF